MGDDDSDDRCSSPNTGSGEEVDEVNKERDSDVEGNVETTGKDVEEGCTGADVDVDEGCTDVEVEGDADTSENKVEEGCTVEVTDVVVETGGSDINTRGVDSCILDDSDADSNVGDAVVEDSSSTNKLSVVFKSSVLTVSATRLLLGWGSSWSVRVRKS